VTNFSIAVSETWTDKAGQKQERTEWFSCSAYGKTGELVARYLSKGDAAMVIGKLRSREYEKDGEKRKATDLIVREVVFLGKSNGGAKADGPAPDDSDDMPF
jgi:single-strand DNA-binding protein